MPATIKLVIADDHQLFIDGLKMLFSSESDMEVMDIACDGKELLLLLQKTTADVILMDVNMPRLNGLEAARLIRHTYPLLKIVMLSTYNDDHLVEKAKQLGANGYLLKTANKEELLQTIRLVAGGQACFPYRQPISRTSMDAGDNFLKQFNLTKREVEILRLIKDNHTNQQIADKLFLSIYTVETHRKNIMQKFGLKSPGALFKFVMEYNI